MAELAHIHPLTVITGNGKSKETKIDYQAIKKATAILRAINHKLRQHILQALEEKKRMTVTEIYVHLRLEQSVASQHLAIMRKAGIVKTIREGKFIWYSVNNERLQEISFFVENLLG